VSGFSPNPPLVTQCRLSNKQQTQISLACRILATHVKGGHILATHGRKKPESDRRSRPRAPQRHLRRGRKSSRSPWTVEPAARYVPKCQPAARRESSRARTGWVVEVWIESYHLVLTAASTPPKSSTPPKPGGSERAGRLASLQFAVPALPQPHARPAGGRGSRIGPPTGLFRNPVAREKDLSGGVRNTPPGVFRTVGRDYRHCSRLGIDSSISHFIQLLR
jgi:hypothetical protein